MKIFDDAERVQQLAGRAFGGLPIGRPTWAAALRQFNFGVWKAGEDELVRTGDIGDAIAAAVEEYQEDRQRTIAFRQSLGWPTEDDDGQALCS